MKLRHKLALWIGGKALRDAMSNAEQRIHKEHAESAIRWCRLQGHVNRGGSAVDLAGNYRGAMLRFTEEALEKLAHG